MTKRLLPIVLSVAVLSATNALGQADDSANGIAMPMMAKGLILPTMDPVAGRKLYASKGCVLCHSVNGLGRTDASALDASLMANPMNPFDFAASMWRGSEAMVALQRDELGGQIELTGQEFADIAAFVHDQDEQAKFSMADLPAKISALMMKMPGDN